MYSLYSRAIYDKEQVMMVQVRYFHFLIQPLFGDLGRN
jgi:hypothetical protein